MKTENGDSIYHGKDGRLRVYIRETGKTISYPKYKMEKELGRQLLPNEHVHHKDLNPLNNDLSNLKIMTSSEHAAEHMRKYYDTIAICTTFIFRELYTPYYEKGGVKVRYTTGFISYPRVDHQLAQDRWYPV